MFDFIGQTIKAVANVGEAIVKLPFEILEEFGDIIEHIDDKPRAKVILVEYSNGNITKKQAAVKLQKMLDEQ